MCTLIVFDRLIPGYPVIAAANRDELYARPATGPLQLSTRPWVVGPRDDEAGGTWIGVSGGRFFAGLTNRPQGEARNSSPRSRGEVMMAALGVGSVEAVIAEIGALPERRYNGFNLLCAGPEGAGLAVYGNEREARRLTPGVHILTNRGLNLPEDSKVRRIRKLLGDTAALDSAEGALAVLARVLADHEGGDILERVCIHSAIYGTRSSTLIALHEADPARSVYRHTEGASCETPWKDVSDLLHSAPVSRVKGDTA